MHKLNPNLDELFQVAKIFLVIDRHLSILAYDAVVLHFSVEADAQRVVAWKANALANEEETICRGTQQVL